MSRLRYNGKFAYATFEEECKKLNKPVHVLTFQTEDAWKQLTTSGVYAANPDYGSRDGFNDTYKYMSDKLGYTPIWCYNPLQFGDNVSTTWNPDWFEGGGLWRRFIEHAAFDPQLICLRVLMEVCVPSTELIRDCVHDYGMVCMLKEIRLENLVGCYRLCYPDEDAEDWFYPWIYPFENNTEYASFKHAQQFRDKG